MTDWIVVWTNRCVFCALATALSFSVCSRRCNCLEYRAGPVCVINSDVKDSVPPGITAIQPDITQMSHVNVSFFSIDSNGSVIVLLLQMG